MKVFGGVLLSNILGDSYTVRNLLYVGYSTALGALDSPPGYEEEEEDNAC